MTLKKLLFILCTTVSTITGASSSTVSPIHTQRLSMEIMGLIPPYTTTGPNKIAILGFLATKGFNKKIYNNLEEQYSNVQKKFSRAILLSLSRPQPQNTEVEELKKQRNLIAQAIANLVTPFAQTSINQENENATQSEDFASLIPNWIGL